jgi:Tfp pilus assembly PilM family ATPase
VVGLLRNFRWHRTADKLGPRKLAVLEIGAEQTHLISVARIGTNIIWEQALNLPRLDEDIQAIPAAVARLITENIPEAHYVSIVLSGNIGFVRLLNFPGEPGNSAALEAQVRQTLGADDDYLSRHAVIKPPPAAVEEKKSSEYAVLASALPSAIIDSLHDEIADAGLVPVSLVPTGVIAANLADRHVSISNESGAQGFLWIGSRTSMLLLYSERQLALARQFKIGIRTIIDALMKAFDLDADTALKLFDSGSFDFSANLGAIASGWVHQVGISLDFIERRHGKRVEKLYVYGGGARTKVLQEMFTEAVGRPVVEWDVLNGLGDLTPPEQMDLPPQSFANPLCEAVRIMEKGLKINDA